MTASEQPMAYLHDLYFESAAMIVTLITVGKLLEARSKGRTTDALKSLMALAPRTATVLQNGEAVTVPIAEVRVGDTFLVYPGDAIPVDGEVIEGNSAVNEAALTGESLPVDKTVGSPVSAATVNTSGFLTCRATRVGEDTALEQIIKTVRDAAATKAPIARIADRVSGIFVPVVMTIALVTTAVWLLLGREIGFAMARGIAVLVISCPCALGLATPVAIMVGSGVGAKNGILFKSAPALEATGRVTVVALDKTGTVTEGKPVVTDLVAEDEEALLRTAYLLESLSEHPLAKAVCEAAKQQEEMMLSETAASNRITEFQNISGRGLTAVDGEGFILLAGNAALLKENKLSEAQARLDDFNERTAEWHYLQAAVFYKKNWTNDSKKQLEIAMQMDPENAKYRAAYGKMNAKNEYQQQSANSKEDKQQTYNPYANGAPLDEEPQMGGGNVCSDCISCCYTTLCINCLFNCCCGCR
jgi:Cu2+-exporting ATPase